MNLKYNATIIERVENYKYLGIKLDYNLTFSEHAMCIRSKVIPRLKMLNKVKQILNRKTKLTLYKTLIAPLFDYGDIIYGSLSYKDTMILHK